ncbi:MAG: M1 family metallopeptidase [Kofleriaceae bacterium]
MPLEAWSRGSPPGGDRRRRASATTPRALASRRIAPGAVVAVAAVAAVAGACGSAPPPHVPEVPRAAPEVALAEQVRPLAYRLELEVSPRAPTFRGVVEIELDIAAPTAQLELHAVHLQLDRADVLLAGRREPLRQLDAVAPALRLAAARPLPRGRVTVQLAYRGSTTFDEQGLFRQRVGDRWYLFSQAEAQFARRIAPCFDEPRFKTPWSVSVVAPRDALALGNAEAIADEPLPDGRHRVRFAATPAMASYLLAIAVGPFDVVDLGRHGRAAVPVRLFTPAGRAGRTSVAAEVLPRLIAGLEARLALPLPLRKLDVVAIPDFFGAMENPGLITVDANELLDAARAPEEGRAELRGTLARVLAHELAHQWFGNLVTPRTWRDLWLSESLATWASHLPLDGLPQLDPELGRLTSRFKAWAEDRRAPSAVRRAPGRHVDQLFDTIRYDKGGALVTMLERWLGEARFAGALRAFVAAHAGRAVDAGALARELEPLDVQAGSVLLAALARPGIPTVTFALDCRGAPALEVALAPSDGPLPICVRVDAEPAPVAGCRVFAAPGRWPLPVARCPRWVAANDDLRGYYRAAWRGGAPRPPSSAQTRGERLGLGWELAVELIAELDAVAAGGPRVGGGAAMVTEALAGLRARASSGASLEEDLADLELIVALDRALRDDELPAWRELRARRAAAMLTRLGDPRADAELERVRAGRMLDVLVDAPWPAALTAEARRRARAAPSASREASIAWRMVALAGGAGALRELVHAARRGPTRAASVALTALPLAAAPPLFAALDRGELTWADATPALKGWLARRLAQGPVLAALVARRHALARHLGLRPQRWLLQAAMSLCGDAQAADLQRLVAALPGDAQVPPSTWDRIRKCARDRDALGRVPAPGDWPPPS